MVEIEDVQVLALDGYNSAYLVSNTRGGFHHYNVCPEYEYINLINAETGEKVKVRVQAICNDIGSPALLKDPVCAIHLLLVNLESPNAGDAYGNQTHFLEHSVNLQSMDKAIMCKGCGSFIKNNSGMFNLVTGICPDCVDSVDIDVKKLETTGFYIKNKSENSYKYSLKKAGTSKYYKPLKASDVAENFNIPKVERDLIVMGLGSAGSNILDQLARTNLVDTINLIDFDIVEDKNLRNQIYQKGDIGYDKTYATKSFLSRLKKNNVKTFSERFQEVSFLFVKSKYIVLGFDTIKTRLEAFNKIIDNTIEVKYIVDTRYDDLEASIYLIDTSDEKQMTYYHNTLLSDMENLKDTTPEFRPLTMKQLKELFDTHRVVAGGCSRFNQEVLHRGRNVMCSGDRVDCGYEGCMKYCLDLINKREIKIAGYTVDKEVEVENTCLKQNIVDIYKFASSFITSAIREIELGNNKPFTHAEVTTKGFPAMMKIR